MLDEISQEDWTRARNCIMAIWVGFVFAAGAMATMSVGWSAGVLIFVLVVGSYTLNQGRYIFQPASIVIVCITVLYLADVWPDSHSVKRLTEFMPRV